MEIGNAVPICGIPILQLPRPHLLRKNSRVAFITLPDLKTASFTLRAKQIE